MAANLAKERVYMSRITTFARKMQLFAFMAQTAMLVEVVLEPLPVRAAGVVGLGTAASCNESVLANALFNGGNITFNCGPSPVTITVTGEKVISDTTTIDGGGLVTISGGGTTRIFRTENQAVFSVLNLTLRDGFTTAELGGGAILSGYQSTLVVSNCKFINNKSVSFANGGTGSGDDGGGAIYIKSESSATVDQTEFIDNTATRGSGGAIHNLLSNLIVRDSTFTSNV